MSKTTPSRNGTEDSGERQRPSWYVPLPPIREDSPTVQESLLMLRVPFTREELGDAAEDIDAFLDQFGDPPAPS